MVEISGMKLKLEIWLSKDSDQPMRTRRKPSILPGTDMIHGKASTQKLPRVEDTGGAKMTLEAKPEQRSQQQLPRSNSSLITDLLELEKDRSTPVEFAPSKFRGT